MKAYSPFFKDIEARILEEVKTSELIEGYLKIYEMDISSKFGSMDFIYKCECPLTKLKFYYPFDLDGDAKFYEELSLKDWYYNQERWEHEEALKYIQEDSSVLEIGSGDGAFLAKLTSRKKVNYTGLELNHKAIKRALEKGISLNEQTLQEHTATQSDKRYDVVCSFQVLEHISNIGTILNSSVTTLREGGTMIIAVPNNDVKFIGENKHPSKFLNMPPHHVNLFTEASLIAIAEKHGLKVNAIIKEPLQDAHIEVFLYNFLVKKIFHTTFIVNSIWKLRLHYLITPFVRLFRKKITGHTIIAVLQKVQ